MAQTIAVAEWTGKQARSCTLNAFKVPRKARAKLIDMAAVFLHQVPKMPCCGQVHGQLVLVPVRTVYHCSLQRPNGPMMKSFWGPMQSMSFRFCKVMG
jgi:hypothetical protein